MTPPTTNENEEPHTTQTFPTCPNGTPLSPSIWSLLPTYHLRLTRFHTSRLHQPSRATVLIPTSFSSPDAANAAALQLATLCRSSGESVMLVSRTEGAVDTLPRYAVGRWDWAKSVGVPCKWSLILEFERGRVDGHMHGDLSAYVEVVRCWNAGVAGRGGECEIGELQSADQRGKPPRGLGAGRAYRFGRYRMVDARAWQPVVTTTPLDRLKREEGLEDFGMSPLTVGGNRVQHPVGAWLPQNRHRIFVELRRRVENVWLAGIRTLDPKERFDRDTTRLEKPTDIEWPRAKKSVVLKDMAMLKKKIKKYTISYPEVQQRSKARRTRVELLIQKLLVWPLEMVLLLVAAASYYWWITIRAVDSRVVSIMSMSPSAPKESQKSATGETQGVSRVGTGSTPPRAQQHTNPNECNCNAHQWRRENFPYHSLLPSPEPPRSETINPKLAAQIRNAPPWYLDLTHTPRHGQHFIPERALYPEPTTLRGYIRRQLETTQPVPREAYIRFGVMTEKDCVARYGPNWRLNCERVQGEWDHERNVKKRKRRPSVVRTSEWPESELDGYEGCLLDHERSWV